MRSVLDYPLAIFALAFAGQWLAAYLGYFLRTRRGPSCASDSARVRGVSHTSSNSEHGALVGSRLPGACGKDTIT